MNREEYLSRQIINTSFVISENWINIESKDSIFIQCRMPEKLELKKLLFNLKELEAHEKNGKLKLKGKTKFKKICKELYPVYLETYHKILYYFNNLKEVCQILEKDGMHIGTVDDEVLIRAMDINYEIQKMNYFNTEYSCFVEKYNKLNITLSNMKWMNKDIINYTVYL